MLAEGHRPKNGHLQRGLQRAFHLGFNSQEALVVTDPPGPAGLSEALSWIVKTQLQSKGPLGVEQLSDGLRLERDQIGETLARLVERGEVTTGRFVDGQVNQQYLLTEDLLHLELLAQGEEHIASEQAWLRLLWRRIMAPGSPQEVMERLGGAVNPMPLWLRCRDFAPFDWLDSLTAGEFVQARFRAGSLLTLPASLVPLYVSAYGGDPPREGLETMLLKLLKSRPEGSTRQELKQALNQQALQERETLENYSTEHVSDILSRLEWSLQVHRRPVSVTSPRPLQRYLAMPELPFVEKPLEGLVRGLLKGQGPATREQLRQMTGLDGRVLGPLLTNLETQGKIQRMACAGLRSQNLYLVPTDRDELARSSGPLPPPTLLHRQDPLTLRYRNELQARFGEQWTLALFDEGRPAGVVNLEARPGLMEVTGLRLARPELLTALLDRIENVAGYYRHLAGDVILWRKGLAGPLGQDEQAWTPGFEKAGYLNRWDLLARGELLELEFPFNQLLAFMLARQHIHPSYRFPDSKSAILGLREMRDLYELSLRVEGPFHAPGDYAPELNLVAGPGAFAPGSNLTLNRASLLQALHPIKATPQMTQLLRLLAPGPLTIEGLLKRTNLDRPSVSLALKGLRQSLLVVKDPWGSYKRLETETSISHEQAAQTLIKETLAEFGLVSFDGLLRLLGQHLSRGELTSALTALTAEGELEKGFLNSEESELHYLLKDQAGKISSIKDFKGAFVIAPTDRLAKVLTPLVKREFGITGAHIVCQGPRLSGAFKLRRQGRRVEVVDFEGSEADRYIVTQWARLLKLDLSWAL